MRADGARLPDNRVEGAWRTAEGGYTVELRLPRTLVGSRLAIAVVDVEDPQSRTAAARLETSGTESRDAAAVVVAPPPAAAALLDGLAGPATRLWLVDTGKHVVAQSGALEPPVRADLRWPASWLVARARASAAVLRHRTVGRRRDRHGRPGAGRLGRRPRAFR